MKKIKLLTISDIPICQSGVGNQSMLLFQGLLKTGKYVIRSMGGAVKHPGKNVIVVDKEKYGEDFLIWPVDGFGDAMILRQLIDGEKPDALLLVTDPRFFIWVWEIWDEIHPRMPILYWHLWDNYPIPYFNKIYYDSCDFIGCINWQTTDFLEKCGTKTPYKYIPHALPNDLYFPLDEEINIESRKKIFKDSSNKCVFLYVGRNARRKGTSSLMMAFSKLKEKYKDVFLFMHTDPNDMEGPHLVEVAKMLKLEGNKDILFAAHPLPVNLMRELYNASDFTVNSSNAEGYGLCPSEAMNCGTRAIVARTGGLKDQIIHPDLGDYMEIDAKFLAGSQQIPYIYDDYVDIDTIFESLEKNYLIWKKEGRKSLREKCIAQRDNFRNKFNYDKMINDWDTSINETLVKHKEDISNRKIFIKEF